MSAGAGIREHTATGLEALQLASALLQRARLAHPVIGLWEAADVQWAWCRPRGSDEVEKLFWLDDAGPVAGVLLTGSPPGRWQCDPIVVPGVPGPAPETVWHRAVEHAQRFANDFEIPVDDNDTSFVELATASGLTAAHHDDTAWLQAANWSPRAALPAGFVLSDRSQRPAGPHPMSERNGPEVGQRLADCPLYDPALDLAVETADGELAGYSLCWFDPVTKVGLVEPVRVEDAYQRRGLAGAMISAGIDRLTARGATRLKVSFESPAAGALYQGLGFVPTSTTTWFRS